MICKLCNELDLGVIEISCIIDVYYYQTRSTIFNESQQDFQSSKMIGMGLARLFVILCKLCKILFSLGDTGYRVCQK